MKIKGIEKINAPKVPTVKDLEQGDIFIFLSGNYENELLMLTDADDCAVRLCDGYAVDTYDYFDTPIKKLNCCLVIEE